MTEAEKHAFLDALGRETSSVIIAELQKIDGATQRDLLAAIESVVVHAFAAVDLAKGREGKLLKTMRDNAMRRLARHRLMQSLPDGGAEAFRKGASAKRVLVKEADGKPLRDATAEEIESFAKPMGSA